MIVADTNVLSEPLRNEPDAGVLAWLERHRPEIVMTSVTVAELLYGVHRLPKGRRRTRLLKAVETLVAGAAKAGRILDFDRVAAAAYAELRAAQDARGRPVAVEDTMIAAIARAGGHAVATRNVQHFDDAGLEVINPWTVA